MSDAPERIWAWKEDHGDVWTGEWCPAEDAEFIPSGAWEMIRTTASPEAFAALEPVRALIGALIEEAAGVAFGEAMGALSVATDGFKSMTLVEGEAQADDVYQAIRALTPSEALAALAAREAAAERRGWLAGMERAAGMASPWSIEASEAIRAEMEKEG